MEKVTRTHIMLRKLFRKKLNSYADLNLGLEYRYSKYYPVL